MKPFIVVSDGFDKTLFEDLKKVEAFDVHPESKISQDELKKLLPKINGLVIRSATKMNQEYIDMAPNLKYIIRAGEGTDNIDKEYCHKKGVKVSNTPGANNNSAAEHAIALMMTALRKTAEADASMKAGNWEKSAFVGNELTNKTIGIVGFGRIGQIVAKRIQGFEPKILFFDPVVGKSDLPHTEKVETLEEIFERSDIITLHLPLIEKTKNLVTKNLLSKMKPDAILVNCARGKIVNEEDLYNHLKDKKIKCAAFDVFASEPLEDNSKLRKLDNIIMTPHLGASTKEAQTRVGAMTINQLREFFLHEKLINEVKA